MSASMQPMYGAVAAAPFFCYERVVMVQQPKGNPPGPSGMFQAGAAAVARNEWLAGLLSSQTDNLQGVAPSTSVYYSGGTPLPLFGGAGSLVALDPFAVTQVVDATITTSGLNGRFNTSSAGAGNWLESDSSFDVTLSPPKTAFGFYVMDLGDHGTFDEGATLTIEYYSGATLLERVTVPHNPPDSPSSDEAMWVGYENTAVPFNLVRFIITQSAADSADYDYVGFDDFTIGTHEVCTPSPTAQPNCGELVVMVKQAQSFGGTPLDDGMPQSGPAVTAKTTFVSGLQSSLAANMDHVAASTSNITTTVSMWSGFGTIERFGLGASSTLYFANNLTQPGNGRFNASANVSGNWLETSSGWAITLTAARTAFGCYIMDLGDVREGEVEFRLFNGSSLVRVVAPPTISADKPRTSEAMWMGYANGNLPFNRIEAHVRQYSTNPSQRDFVGFDDFVVGEVVTCTPSASPTVFYGANTAGDAAKTVTGAAQTARNSWVATAGTPFVCDFEAASLGLVTLSTPMAFSNGATSFNATFLPVQYTVTHAADVSIDTIDNSAGSLRWNTTAGGSKWYELNDELTIVLPAARTNLGFYVTDLGNQNATLRVTLRRADGSGVSYYLPKATALPSPDSLLRFWGVTNELPFTSVVIQPVYYTDLTENSYTNPVSHVVSPRDVIGLDDIMVA
jgi:hypothetical protein